ncbi:nucleotidyltransferase domain-containing protein [Burkholderia pyrrocinia]|uniref:nucleotidyltransferase domain-containing protein n=1 Tax=Burkholderia pyrrocinia TaxID=60550 RepID=UPI001BCACB82|nr:hypothetical protein [Burkholderia pyrrocinia]QVN22986.1 hypothetical protein JYG32_36710 [Burkholderia pyrrocinia]
MAIPDQQAWNAWQPAVLAQRLGDIHLPWCVVGGWALDLWHGTQTREHDDLEFTMLREDFGRFRQARSDLAFYTAHAGVVENCRKTRKRRPKSCNSGDSTALLKVGGSI